MIKIALGADHRGFAHKQYIINYFSTHPSCTFIDVGTNCHERTDYPIYAEKLVELIVSGQVQQGILLCGSGIGMAIAANRHKGIRAGVVWNDRVAKMAKEDDNVNVLVLPSDYISHESLIPLIDSWLYAEFKGGRYAERIEMLDK
jgi:ribose 5-phosphate isomerase B